MKAQRRLIRMQQRPLTDLDVQRQSAIRHAQRVGNVQAAAAVQRREHIQFRPDWIFFRKGHDDVFQTALVEPDRFLAVALVLKFKAEMPALRFPINLRG